MIEAETDGNVFDSSFLPDGFTWTDVDSLPRETRRMWDYVSVMEAGQSVALSASGGRAGVSEPGELVAGDHLVLAGLSVLGVASSDLAERIVQWHRRGIRLELLREGFVSPAQFSELHLSAVLGDVAMVETLLGGGTDVDDDNCDQGLSALQIACCFGHGALVHRLIQIGANVNHRSHLGFTALHQVARRGDSALASQLIDSGVDVNAIASDGSSPLCWAVLKGHIELAGLLLRSGASADVAGIGASEVAGPEFRMTPLYYAAANDDAPLAQLLLRFDADPSHPNARGPGGHSALHEAARMGDRGLVEALLEAGASPQEMASDGTTPRDWVDPSNATVFRLLGGG